MAKSTSEDEDLEHWGSESLLFGCILIHVGITETFQGSEFVLYDNVMMDI